MKRNLWLFAILFLVLVLGAIDPFEFFVPNRKTQELAVLRLELVEYAYVHKVLPDTLDSYFKSNSQSILRHAGTIKESSVLDYAGGWYYSPAKKVIGINERKYANEILSLSPSVSINGSGSYIDTK